MRVVYIWDADYPWDVRVEKTCLALTEAGHEVHIVSRNRRRRAAEETLREGVVHRMPALRLVPQRIDSMTGFPAFFNPRWHRLVERCATSIRADLIIARDLPLCPTALQVGRAHGIPVVLDMAENYPALMRAIWETGRERIEDYFIRNPRAVAAVERYCLDRVTHTIVVVEESRDRVLKLGVDARKISVVSNTPPAARALPKPMAQRHQPGNIDVVYMGNLEVARGLIEAIDAIKLLRDQGVSVRLRIIGAGRDEALIAARAADQGLGPDAVEFLGFIPSHADALQIVSSADIGLLPHRKCESWDTTIPNKLFDYMAAGLPVVSSDAAPCERILTETGAGTVYASGNADGMAAAILGYQDPRARQSAGERGRTAVRDRYNWETDGGNFVRLLEMVVGG